MIVDQYGRPFKNPAAKKVVARYDSAQTTDNNRKHWAGADSLSAVSANSAQVRQTLRDRSRYEIANNSYCRGIINTLSAYTVGSGPSLQLTYRGPDVDPNPAYRQAAQQVERLWSDWAYQRELSQKVSTLKFALDGDGEGFAIITSSQRINPHTPVQLDLRLYECDHFDDYSGTQWLSDDAGVRINAAGEVTEYAFCEQHPGDALVTAFVESDWISADQVIHLFRCERPGQLRGVPKTTPALPLFALLRRFVLATCTAAETAADFAAILYGDAAAEDEDMPDPWDRLEIEYGALLTVPGGQRLAQLKAEHPNATFDEFVKAVLREIARCLGAPAVIALGDASKYNYASGRLDLQAFEREIEVERSQLIERKLLDRLWEEWLDEALLIPGFLPDLFVQQAEYFDWAWRWTQPGHVDRKKEADGQAVELANHTTTLAREYARRGLDWELELQQRAREVSRMRELGLTTVAAAASTEADNEREDAEEETAEAARIGFHNA